MKILASAEIPPSVVQYDDAIDEPLQRLLKLSADIGDDLQVVVCPSDLFFLFLLVFYLVIWLNIY